MKVAVVIATFNSADLTEAIVRRILDISSKVEVIIIDAGSNDWKKLCNSLIAYKERIKIYYIDEDLGGAGSFKLGVYLALRDGYDVIILNDNDAYPLSDNLIDNLIKNVLEYNVAAPKLHIYNNFEQEDYTISRKWSVSTFHFLGIKANVFRDVGLPFAFFFIRGEDTDLTWRLHSKGYKIYRLKDTYIHPFRSKIIKCIDSKLPHWMRNSIIFVWFAFNNVYFNSIRFKLNVYKNAVLMFLSAMFSIFFINEKKTGIKYIFKCLFKSVKKVGKIDIENTSFSYKEELIEKVCIEDFIKKYKDFRFIKMPMLITLGGKNIQRHSINNFKAFFADETALMQGGKYVYIIKTPIKNKLIKLIIGFSISLIALILFQIYGLLFMLSKPNHHMIKYEREFWRKIKRKTKRIC